MSDPPPEDRALLAVTAALLETGRGVDALARPLTVLAFAGLLVRTIAPVPSASLGALFVAALAGLAACYVGARVAFDAGLFTRLPREIGGLGSLDRALTTLGVLPDGKAGRPLGDRVAGATRLLRRQLAWFAVQIAALLLAGAAALPRP